MKCSSVSRNLLKRIVTIIVLFIVSEVGQVTGQCSSTLNVSAALDASQRIESPNYPLTYPARSRCSWRVDSGGTDRRVYLWVAEYNIERNYDYLKIYDGTSSSSPLLGYIDGSGGDRMYQSSGRYLYIFFYSDFSVQKVGFWSQYFSLYDNGHSNLNSVPCVSASSNLHFTPATSDIYQQTLESFPGKYSGSDFCHWRLDAASGMILNISVFFMDVYRASPTCSGDRLSIYNGPSPVSANLIRAVCDAAEVQYGQVSIQTTGQQAYLVFHRGSVGMYRGFVLSYNEISPSGNSSYTQAVTTPSGVTASSTCGQVTLMANADETGYITSPNYPFDYSSSLSCLWLIEANLTQSIYISIEAVYLEDGKDFLRIYDGPTNSFAELASLTGSLTDGNFTTNGSSAMIQFTSDASIQSTGFKISYTAINSTLPNCLNMASNNTFILNASGTENWLYSHIDFNDFGNTTYNNDEDVFWLIKKPQDDDNLVMFVQDFSLENSASCSFDYLRLYDGPCTSSSLLNSLCGEISPGAAYQASKSRYLLAHFHSDSFVTRSGFKIKYYIGQVTVTPSSVDDKSKDSNETLDTELVALVLFVLVLAIIVTIIFLLRFGKSPRKRNAPTLEEMKRGMEINDKDRPTKEPVEKSPTNVIAKKEKVADRWKLPIYKPENKVAPAKTKERIDTEELLRNVLPIPDPFSRQPIPDFVSSKPPKSSQILPSLEKSSKDTSHSKVKNEDSSTTKEKHKKKKRKNKKQRKENENESITFHVENESSLSKPSDTDAKLNLGESDKSQMQTESTVEASSANDWGHPAKDNDDSVHAQPLNDETLPTDSNIPIFQHREPEGMDSSKFKLDSSDRGNVDEIALGASGESNNITPEQGITVCLENFEADNTSVSTQYQEDLDLAEKLKDPGFMPSPFEYKTLYEN